jgi:hypothetical protein
MAILTLGQTCPLDIAMEDDNYEVFFIPHLKKEVKYHTKMVAKPRQHLCL